jgi:hypothetical protein
VGYEKQIVKIAGQTNLTITMVETNSNLDEIVIVGYGTAKKIDVTGSIASVKGSDIQNLPVSTVASAWRKSNRRPISSVMMVHLAQRQAFVSAAQGPLMMPTHWL